MLALLLLIPLFAGLVAGTRHGVLAGLAAGAVAAIAELLLLSIAGVAARRRDAKQAAARQAAAADAADLETPAAQTTQAATGAETIDADASKPYVPPPPAARSAELRARRPEDRTRAIDLLPSPLGSRPAWLDGDDGQRLPAYLGAYASYQRLSLDLDPRSTSAAAVYRQLYDGLREACAKHVDLELNRDESQPDIAPIDDLPEHFDAKRHVDDTLFVAFRTRDARWAGFRLGRDSFRLPLERLCGFALNVGIPAKGPGGYEIETIFDRPRRDTEADAQWQSHGSTFQPSLPYADRHSFALLHALSTAAQLFDVRLASSTFSDC